MDNTDDDCEFMKGYVLISVKLGRTNDVLKQLKKIPGVTTVAVITGEFDVIVRVETQTMNEMYNLTQEIHLVDGIEETTTSIIQKEF